MQVKLFHSVTGFAQAAEPFLETRELDNGLLLGVVEQHLAELDTLRPFMALVLSGGEVVGAGWHTPQWKMFLSHMPAEAAALLAESAAAAGLLPPGVLGGETEVREFARRFAHLTASEITAGTPHHIYRCDQVIPPPPAPGFLRPARPDEADLVAGWNTPRRGDATLSVEQQQMARLRKKLVRLGRLYFWDDHGPVSMCGIGGETRHGCRISNVVTLDAMKGKGYASAGVAALTALCLDRGKYCFLDAAITNEVANRMYLRVGYRPLSMLHERLFAYPAGPAD